MPAKIKKTFGDSGLADMLLLLVSQWSVGGC